MMDDTCNLTDYEQTWPRSNREWMVKVWNKAYPPDTPVMVWPLGQRPFKTRTMSPAQLSSGYPVVMVEGHSAWIDLLNCLPLEEEAVG